MELSIVSKGPDTSDRLEEGAYQRADAAVCYMWSVLEPTIHYE